MSVSHERGAIVVAVPAAAAQYPFAVDDVRLTDPLLGRLREVLRSVSLPLQYQRLEQAGVLANFVRAAGGHDGPFCGKRYADSDLYKWIEAACWICADEPDDWLVRTIEESLDLIEAAQQPDGYLNTHFSGPDVANRWTNVRGLNEFYVAGHLFHAAVAHSRVFGSTWFLDIARRMADHMMRTFGPEPGQLRELDSHPGIEMALVELARETGDERYVELADFFLTLRGHGLAGGMVYNQDDVPFRDRETFEGHAVCAGYLCCGAADLYLETGDDALRHPQERMWDNLTQRRMYVTGGMGSRWIDESVGLDFELPNSRAYAETCAAVSSVMWNWRLLLTTGKSRYADLLEHVLYNGVLPGVSLDGRQFYYQNVLQDSGRHRRSDWFEISCCPPNLSRLIGSIPGYVYTHDEHSVSVNLYAASTADLRLGDGWTARIEQHTDYPRDGHVRLHVSGEGQFALRMRVPRFARSAFMIRVDDEAIAEPEIDDGYLQIRRSWGTGVVIELDFPMPVRTVRAHPHALENDGRLAVLRGPLLYCAEGVDNPGPDSDPIDLLDLELAAQPTDIHETIDPDVLAGALRIEVPARVRPPAPAWASALYLDSHIGPPVAESTTTAVRLVPYYSWANREPGQMLIWLRGAPDQNEE